MKCRDAQRLLSAGHDGEIDLTREPAVHEHVARCPQCAQFATALSRCAPLLDRWTAPHPQSGFTHQVLVRLGERPPGRPWLRAWIETLRPLTAAAAMIALFCGIALAVAMNGESTAPPAGPPDPEEAIYAESFDPVPSSSLGAGYLALLQEREE